MTALHDRLRRWLNLPDFGDEEQQRLARILSVLLGALFLAAATLLIVHLLTTQYLPVVIGMTVGIAVALVAYGLVRARRLQTASLVTLLTMTGVVSYIVIAGGGVHDVAIIAYPMIIVTASILLPRRLFIALTVFVIGLVVVIGVAEMSRWLVSPFSYSTVKEDVVSIVVILTLTAVTARLLADNLVHSLARTRQELEERRRVEEAYRAVVDNSLQGLIIFQDERVVFANPAMAQMLDYTAEELLALTSEAAWAIVHPDQHADLAQRMQAVLSGGELEPVYELRVIRKDGAVRWLAASGSVIQYAGRPALQAAAVDITERKQAEQALRRSAARMEIEHGIDSAVLGALLPEATAQAALDEVRPLVGSNRASVTLFDFEANEAYLLAVSPRDPARFRAKVHIPLEEYGRYTVEELRRTRRHVIEDIASMPQASATDKAQLAEGTGAWLVAPLIYQGELIGALNLGFEHVGRIEADLITIARELAAQLAIAIQNARLFEETAEALRREQRLNKVARAISGSLELPTVLQNVTRLAIELVDADAGTLALLSPDGASMTDVYDINIASDLSGQTLPRGRGVTWQVLAQRQAIVLSNYADHPDALPEWVRFGVRAFLGMPLVAGDTVLGVLGLASLRRAKRFTKRDGLLAESVGRQAGIAIANARLFEAQKRQLTELSVLHSIAVAATEVEQEDALIERAVEIVSNTLYPDVFGVLLLDARAGVLRPHPASRGGTPELMQTVMPLGHGVVGTVAVQGQPWRIPDVSRVPAYVPSVPEINSELCVPLKVGERVLGVIVVDSHHLDAFSEADERLLVTAAGQLASAMERFRSQAALRRSLDRMAILHEIDRAILLAQSPETTAAAALDKVRTLVNCRRASVTLFDFAGNEAILLAVSVPGQTQSPAGTRNPLEVFGRYSLDTLQRKQPYVVEDILARDDRTGQEQQLAETEGVRAWLLTPLVYQDELIGSLNLGFAEPGRPGPELISTASGVAAQIAIAIQQARLFEQTSEALVREQRLTEIVRTISGALDLPTVLENVTRLAVELVEADAGTLGLLAPDGLALTDFYDVNVPDALKDQTTPRGEGVTWQVVNTRQPLLLTEYASHPAAMPDWVEFGVGAYLGVPVMAGDMLLGVLGLVSLNPDKRFTARDVTLAGSVGRQAGIAIENARLFETVQQELRERQQIEAQLAHQLEEGQALFHISQALASSLDLSTILQRIVEAASALTHPDRAVIHLLDKSGTTLQAVAVAGGEAPMDGRNLNFGWGRGIAGHVIATGETVNLADAPADPRYLQLEGQGGRVRSLLVAPVHVGEKRLGTLSVHSARIGAFTEADARLLTTLGVQAGLAIENGRLFEVERRRVREAETLHQVTQSLISRLKLPELLRAVVEAIAAAAHYQYVSLFVRERDELRLQAFTGYAETVIRSLPVTQGIVGRVARTGIPAFVPDVTEDHDYLKVVDDVQSAIAVPLQYAERLLGVLLIESAANKTLDENDLSWLMNVGRQISAAMENARLYHDLENALQQEKSTRAHMVQSEKLAAMGRLTASVAHELNNPLQATQNALYLVGQESALSAQTRADLEVAASETHRMADLISRLRETYRPATGEQFRPESLNTLVEEVRKLIATHLRRSDIQWEFEADPHLPPVPAIRDQLKQAILNLSLNAVEAMPSGGRLSICTRYQPEGAGVELTIADTGGGIEQALLPNIFDPFFTTKESGTGLGLAITRDIIERHRGHIEATSTVGQGTAFTIWLPLEPPSGAPAA